MISRYSSEIFTSIIKKNSSYLSKSRNLQFCLFNLIQLFTYFYYNIPCFRQIRFRLGCVDCEIISNGVIMLDNCNRIQALRSLRLLLYIARINPRNKTIRASQRERSTSVSPLACLLWHKVMQSGRLEVFDLIL